MSDFLQNPRFPRAAKYNPDWLRASVSGGANPLWLAEWLSEAVELKPGMRVLDLGCGRAVSSIFFRREFGCQVWAADLWFHPTENARRVEAAGVADGVFPLRADARSLPFADEFFDAVLSIDSFFYYGTDSLYLNYLLRFLKPGGVLGIAGAGLTEEFAGRPPAHFQTFWTPGMDCLHSAGWWRQHWERTGLVDVERADDLPDGWKLWVEWQQAIAPGNRAEIDAVKADAGRHLGYVRAVARRRAGIALDDLVLSVPPQYTPAPLLR